MKFLQRIIRSFEWETATDLIHSLFPSTRHGVVPLTLTAGGMLTITESLLGLNLFSVLFFAAALGAELFTGLKASAARGESFNSTRLGRFTVKLAGYMVIIGMFWSMRKDAAREEQMLLAAAFTWLWSFSLLFIAAELAISILENIATIDGKPKDAYIQKIREKLKNF